MNDKQKIAKLRHKIAHAILAVIEAQVKRQHKEDVDVDKLIAGLVNDLGGEYDENILEAEKQKEVWNQAKHPGWAPPGVEPY